MQMYVNFFDRFHRAEHEANTIGIVLCSEKNDAMVKITLPKDNKGTSNCLSALVAAERYEEVLALLELAPFKFWSYRQYGVKALAAQRKTAEAVRYAEEGRGLNDSPIAIARACEEVLLSAGLTAEAYRQYGLLANQGGTYLATFRAVTKRYPTRSPSEVLADLVKSTPGDEGKWFAAAKDVELFDDALDLASRTPCDPRTLTRAARNCEKSKPIFAVGAGLLGLHWLIQGYGYEITSADVWAADVKAQLRKMVAAETASDHFISKVLSRELQS